MSVEPMRTVTVGRYMVRSVFKCVGAAVGHQPLIVGVAFLSLGAKQEGVMAGSFDHNIEEVGTVGAVDLCTDPEGADAASLTPAGLHQRPRRP